MALRPSASQVVTYAAPNPGWSIAVQGGVTGPPAYFTPWAASAAPIRTGHKFRLYTGASLKEDTVFTVTGVSGPAFGYVNATFGPQPAAAPAAGDTATAWPYPVLAEPRWLGSLGTVTGLKYSFTCPGGCEQMTCVLHVPSSYRTDALNPGRMVQVIRGASVVWDGRLEEPTPGDEGWTITATGSGKFGDGFDAVYTGAWGTGTPDNAVNAAIGRGLRWQNPGIGSPAGMWVGQSVDSGQQSITDLLNLVCNKGALTWYVKRAPSGNYLQVFAPPATPDRLLLARGPVARSVGGDVNRLHIRYQSSRDASAPAVYSVTSAEDTASISAHGPMEHPMDLSSAGGMSSGGAQGIGNAVLGRYKRASFAQSFGLHQGDLMTMGGTPVDLGCEQAATVCKLILTDFGYGGEITPVPVSFLTGRYEYDEDTQTAAVTPFQSITTDFAGLLSAAAELTGPGKPGAGGWWNPR